MKQKVTRLPCVLEAPAVGGGGGDRDAALRLAVEAEDSAIAADLPPAGTLEIGGGRKPEGEGWTLVSRDPGNATHE